MKVLPTEIHGASSILTKECIGPVRADETLIISSVPKASAAQSVTSFTKG